MKRRANKEDQMSTKENQTRAPEGLHFTSRARDTRRVLKDSFNFQGKISLEFSTFQIDLSKQSSMSDLTSSPLPLHT